MNRAARDAKRANGSELLLCPAVRSLRAAQAMRPDAAPSRALSLIGQDYSPGCGGRKRKITHKRAHFRMGRLLPFDYGRAS